MSNSISIKAAIKALKSGKSLKNKTLSDLDTSVVDVMDALLLAEHGILVPEANIVYDDSKIAYDPDFDDAEWGKPVSVKEVSIQAKDAATDLEKPKSPKAEKLVIELSINAEVKDWIESNDVQVDIIIGKLLTDLYNTEKLLKSH